MSKLLTIAIPTYNHDHVLDKKLAWLAAELEGVKQDCEIIIFDNCSTDKTLQILEKWRLALGSQVSFTYHSHEENIGEEANMVSCLRIANGKFVWALRDDDVVQSGTVEYLLSKIKEHSNLSVILLNGFGRNMHADNIERYFNGIADRSMLNNASAFRHFLEAFGRDGLSASSAVYRTRLVKKALLSWPDSAKNLASQLYWVAYCAALGSLLITPSIHIEGVTASEFKDKRKQKFRVTFCGIPDVYLELMKLGYPKYLCLSMTFRNLRSNDSWRIFFAALRRWPVFTIRGFIYYIRDIGIATWLCILGNGSQQLLEDLARLG